MFQYEVADRSLIGIVPKEMKQRKYPIHGCGIMQFKIQI